jgi:hypothetical protein
MNIYISFLGTGNYKPATYSLEENTNLKKLFESKGNRFFQEIEDIVQQMATQHLFMRMS